MLEVSHIRQSLPVIRRFCLRYCFCLVLFPNFTVLLRCLIVQRPRFTLLLGFQIRRFGGSLLVEAKLYPLECALRFAEANIQLKIRTFVDLLPGWNSYTSL